ncbi:MAG: hypothetical protein Q7S21_01120, partial [archaeon]|nr:hypothetical protein [archaeon]
GASANLFSIAPFFLFSLALLSLIVVPFVSPWAIGIHKESVSGVEVNKVLDKFEICGDEYPSDAFGKLEVGQKIKEANGVPILLASDLQLILNKDPKQLNLLVDSNGVASNVSLKANEIGGFGFQVKEIQTKPYPTDYKIVVGSITFFDSFMSWLILLSLLIALVNFLPMEPFDGGKIAKILFIPYLSFLNISDALKEKIIHQFFLIVVLSLFILNALPLFL